MIEHPLGNLLRLSVAFKARISLCNAPKRKTVLKSLIKKWLLSESWSKLDEKLDWMLDWDQFDKHTVAIGALCLFVDDTIMCFTWLI